MINQPSNKEVIVINMPSPGSVIPGMLLGYYVRKKSCNTQIIGIGNQINVPEVAKLALVIGAFDNILNRDTCALRHTIDSSCADTSSLNRLDVTDFVYQNYPLYHGLSIVPFETSHGCPYQCNFCSERLFWNHDNTVVDKYVTRPVDQSMEEIDFLVQQFSLSGITFNDCLLNTNPIRTSSLLAQ